MGAKSLERGDAATYRDKDRCCDRSTDLVVQEYIRFVVDCVYTRRLISLIVVDSGVHLARLRLVPSGPPSFRARLLFAENRLFLPLPYLPFPSLPFPPYRRAARNLHGIGNGPLGFFLPDQSPFFRSFSLCGLFSFRSNHEKRSRRPHCRANASSREEQTRLTCRPIVARIIRFAVCERFAPSLCRVHCDRDEATRPQVACCTRHGRH